MAEGETTAVVAAAVCKATKSSWETPYMTIMNQSALQGYCEASSGRFRSDISDPKQRPICTWYCLARCPASRTSLAVLTPEATGVRRHVVKCDWGPGEFKLVAVDERLVFLGVTGAVLVDLRNEEE